MGRLRHYAQFLLFLTLATSGCVKEQEESVSSRGASGSKAEGGFTVVTAALSDASQGASVKAPPGISAGQLAIEEGAPVATDVSTAQLGLPAGVVPASPSVNLDASTPMSEQEVGSLVMTLPITSGTGLVAGDIPLERLVVIYQVQAATGGFKIGAIMATELQVSSDESTVSFASRGLGNYQAAILPAPVTKVAEVPTEVPVLKKSAMTTLPTLTWGAVKLSSPENAKLKVEASYEGSGMRLVQCMAYIDTDRTAPWDYAELVNGLEATIDVSKSPANASFSARFTCADSLGRTHQSPWSSEVKVLSSDAPAANLPQAPVAVLTGTPSARSTVGHFTVTVTSANGLAAYRFKVGRANATDCASSTGYSAERAETLTFEIDVSTEADGSFKLCVVGRDAAGVWRSFADATTVTWTKDVNGPSVTIGAIGGALSPASTAGSQTTLSGTASDASGSVAGITYSLEDQASGNCLDASGTSFSALCPNWLTATGTVAWGLSLADSLFADGQSYQLTARSADDLGNTNTATSTFTWDATPPNATFTISEATGAYIKAPSVTLTLSDATDVASYRTAEGSDCSAASWQTYSGTISATLTASDGAKTLCLQVRDALGNASSTATKTVTLDQTAPIVTSTAVAAVGPVTTVGSLTTLTGTVSEANSVASVEVSIRKVTANTCLDGAGTAFGATCPQWRSATHFTGVWQIDVSDGAFADGYGYEVYVRSTDTAGNQSDAESPTSTFDWDASPPNGAFVFTGTGDGASDGYTKNLSIGIELSDDTGVADIMAVNGSSCTGGIWTSYGGSPTLTLPGGDGLKNVCVKVRDAAGNASTEYLNSITLDTVAPSSSITTLGTQGPALLSTSLSITGAASDSGSGVGAVEIKVMNASSECFSTEAASFQACGDSGWVTASGTTSWTFPVIVTALAGGNYTVTARAKDLAGNVQASPATESMTWDTTPPAVFSITGPGAAIDTAMPDIVWGTSTDATSYRVELHSASACGDSSPISNTVADTHSVFGPVADGSYSVCVYALDAVGNERPSSSNPYSLTIDTTAPGGFTIANTSGSTGDDPLTISWGASSGAVSYTVFLNQSTGCTGESITDIAGTSQTFAGLSEGTYYVCVKAVDSFSRETAATNNDLSITIDRSPPQSFAATGPSIDPTSLPITVTWEAATDASPVTYDLVLSSTGDCLSPEYTASDLTGTSQEITSLSDGYYYVCLKAMDSLGQIATASNNGTFGFELLTAVSGWSTLTEGGTVPVGRAGATLVRSGSKFVLWGGRTASTTYTNSGGIFADGSWQSTPTTGAPMARDNHTAVVTSTGEVIVWGGATGATTATDTGGILNVSTNTWTATAVPSFILSARLGHTAVWAGDKMLVFGGCTVTSGGAVQNAYADGAAYVPHDEFAPWDSLGTVGAPPTARCFHSAVWTGNKMIVWGGYGTGNVPTDTGAIYDPTTATWAAMTTTGAPAARARHTAVWTGSKMLVWGGESSSSTYLATGSLYDPADNTWTTINGVGTPGGTAGASVIWNGAVLVVWGGYNGITRVNTGAAFDPSTDVWTSLPTTGAPLGRSHHAAVAVGSQVMIWGGIPSTGPYWQGGDVWTP